MGGKTFYFKDKEGYEGQIKRENEIENAKGATERMALKSAQSVIDTNLSIQDLNTKTDAFYEKQKKYNTAQKFLTFAILLSSAIYTWVAVITYNESKYNKKLEKRLEKLETELHNQ